MRRTRRTAGLLLFAFLFLLAGCDGDTSARSDPGDTAGTEDAQLPKVTPEQAEQALSDAMLVSAVSLLLAFSAEDGETSVSSEDEKLSLSWTDDANFTTGVGTYTMTMDEYAVPADDLFASEYHGYVLDGTVTMGSDDGVRQTMTFHLTTTHADPERFPVQTIDVTISGLVKEGDVAPVGHIRMNGHEMDLDDLAAAFELTG